MTVWRRTLVAAGLTVGVAVTLATAATPAQAEGDCPANHVCMWEDAGYGGDRYVDSAAPQPGASTWIDVDGWNGDNELSAVVNNTGCYVEGYSDDVDHRNGQNYLEKTFFPNSRDANLSDDHFWFVEYSMPGNSKGHTTNVVVDNDIESFVIKC